jgi:CBS domain-containing protein
MTRLFDLIHDKSPLTLPPAVSVKRACEEMRSHRRSAVMVTHPDGYLIGIFTGRDAIWRVLAAGKNAGKVTLGEVMTNSPATISPYTTAIEALRLMTIGGFRHLPVIEKDNIVGIVMRRDFKSEDLSRLEEEDEFWQHLR